MSEKPTLFISHKHADKEIAQVIANFVRSRSLGKVKIHLSSDPTFEGPKFGKSLNAQLRNALWETEVLILVYTTADQDWQYCMWECGMAEYPKSSETNIIVFQCGREVPRPFHDVLRVDARDSEDIKKFTDQFFRDPKFFPSQSEAVAPDLKDKDVNDAADYFYKRLREVLYDDPPQEWSTWGFLKVAIPKKDIDTLVKASETESIRLSHQIVKENAKIVESNPQIPQIFGLSELGKDMNFEELVSKWKEKYPNEDVAWFSSCCEQIAAGVKRNFPIIRWTPIKKVNGDDEFIPVLSRIKPVSRPESFHFYIYLYNLTDPRGISVVDKMLKPEKFFYKKIGQVKPQNVKLRELVAEMDDSEANRLPILNDEGYPLYIIHRSMIDRFFAKQFMSAESISPGDLNLNDLLSDNEMREIFENTFAIVKRQSSLAEAKDAMLAKPGCSDVFVTENGGLNEPVLGWLTNVDITRNS